MLSLVKKIEKIIASIFYLLNFRWSIFSRTLVKIYMRGRLSKQYAIIFKISSMHTIVQSMTPKSATWLADCLTDSVDMF